MRESTPSILTHAFEGWMGPLRRLLPGSFDHYRPEKYYMRGPGPKWLEKHREDPSCAMQASDHGGRASGVSPH
jgi:hypothetical protein